MRGVAAIIVCLSHFQELVGGWYPRFAYLAVDLFFILSGFVISRAYDERLATGMTFNEFFWGRCFTRLLPMLVLGSLLGALTPQARSIEWRIFSFILNGAALPSLPPRRGMYLMPTNPSLWSLFFELWIANLAYGLFYRSLRSYTLVALVVLSALSMIWTIQSAGWLNVGWGWGRHQIAYGFVRVVVSLPVSL